VLAVAGLGVAQQMGYTVPDDLSIVACDDSLLCQVVHPPLTTMTRDVTAFGALACRRLLAAIDDPSVTDDVEAPRAELFPRGSTGPASLVKRRHAARLAP
jgi:DNA-binding LacI/PurR family transcriptional regulator